MRQQQTALHRRQQPAQAVASPSPINGSPMSQPASTSSPASLTAHFRERAPITDYSLVAVYLRAVTERNRLERARELYAKHTARK
jgi:hypothetical protein